MEELKKCSGCQQMKVIVSSDAYGNYCDRCDELNFLHDNDLPDWDRFMQCKGVI